MAVNIGYRPYPVVDLKYVQGGSDFEGILTRLFGLPAVLRAEHIPTLEGVAACGYGGAHDFIGAINSFGAIQIDRES